MQELLCAPAWGCRKQTLMMELIPLIWDFSNAFLVLFMMDSMDFTFKELGTRNDKTMFITKLAAPVPYKQFKEGFSPCCLPQRK